MIPFVKNDLVWLMYNSHQLGLVSKVDHSRNEISSIALGYIGDKGAKGPLNFQSLVPMVPTCEIISMGDRYDLYQTYCRRFRNQWTAHFSPSQMIAILPLSTSIGLHFDLRYNFGDKHIVAMHGVYNGSSGRTWRLWRKEHDIARESFSELVESYKYKLGSFLHSKITEKSIYLNYLQMEWLIRNEFIQNPYNLHSLRGIS